MFVKNRVFLLDHLQKHKKQKQYENKFGLVLLFVIFKYV